MKRGIPIFLILVLIGGVTWIWAQQQTHANSGLKGSGTVEAEQVNIGPEVAGRVVKVFADEGQAVKAGDVLLHLDDALLLAQRVQAEAAVNTARAQREQLLAGARPEQLDVARAAISSTQAALASAQADLNRLLTGVTNDQIAGAKAQLAAASQDIARQLYGHLQRAQHRQEFWHRRSWIG